jgi:hypothetical protein
LEARHVVFHCAPPVCVAVQGCSSGALCTTSSESPRRRFSWDRPSPAIFSYDGALTRRVHLESLFFGGDRRGSRGSLGVLLWIGSFVSSCNFGGGVEFVLCSLLAASSSRLVLYFYLL